MAVVVTEFGAGDLVQSYVGIKSTPAALYVALLNDLPDETVNGTTLAQIEVGTGIGYSRQSIGVGGSNWGIYGDSVGNVNEISFGPATDDWGVVKAWALCDATTAGNVIIANSLPLAYRVLSGRSLLLEEASLSLFAASPVETIVA